MGMTGLGLPGLEKLERKKLMNPNVDTMLSFTLHFFSDFAGGLNILLALTHFDAPGVNMLISVYENQRGSYD